jgi:hypothetical protein
VLAASNGGLAENRRKEMQQTLEDVRIDADIEIVETVDSDTLKAQSADAAMVFLPFRFRANQITTPFQQGNVEEVLAGLPAAALVIAAEDIDLEAEPEEGRLGEIAAARDAMTAARKRLAEAEKAADSASAEVEKKTLALAEAIDAGAGAEAQEKLRAEENRAREEKQQQLRKAAKARMKVEEAEKTLSAMGALPPTETEDRDEKPEEKEKDR